PELRRRPPAPPVPPPKAPTLEELATRLAENGREVDRVFLTRVWGFSAEMHKDQLRRSGEPFLTHPASVAWLLADLRLDQTCVVVGLLHDVLEDTLSTKATIEDKFGAEIAELVDGVTKIGRHSYVRKDDAQAETFRKMILASARDLRVILVKLADRLHNMMTLGAMSPEARRRISQETLEIYAPIAHRLGMAKVKGDLEDLAFFYLYPLQFAALQAKVQEKVKVGRNTVRQIADRLKSSLHESGIEADISFRVKRYYSIYQKLRRQGIDIAELYDYLAFRIVTADLRDTYGALGIVHQNWRPIPGRFKDYIAMPKPNLYQSLHTTVVGGGGQPFEVQIRTREMDLVAEEGIAAHWKYKEGKEAPGHPDPGLLWLRQLVDLHTDASDSRAFMSTLKVDLYPDEVYVFSPKGDVFAFPRGATPLDFAYRIHTDLGHHCAGARINGRLVPLRSALRTGDIVEVLTHPSRQPSRDWLSWVVTPKAKNRVRQWLNTQQTAEAIEVGRRMLDKELHRYRLSLRTVTDGERFRSLLAGEGLARPEDLLARLGYGKLTVHQVLERLLSSEQLGAPPPEPGRLRQVLDRLVPGRGMTGPIRVRGEGDLLVVLAKCCRPVPGEQIVGYVTRGRGISVHSVDCPNVRNLLYNPEREIDVEWADGEAGIYPVSLMIETEDRRGILAKLTEAIAKLDTNIRQIEADTERPGRGNIEVVVDVRDRAHLERVRQTLRGLPGVLEVSRRMPGSGRADRDLA
ncbi:MAG: bifunctional (p)ppGpp synthetase/guanosine-3',5'-bis(diphosphate) 3'-pyrophosphohydrolase, partial [Thermoanaerobaculia bacterium]